MGVLILKKVILLFIFSLTLSFKASAQEYEGEYRFEDFYGDYYAISHAHGRITQEGTIVQIGTDEYTETLMQDINIKEYDQSWLDTNEDAYQSIVKIIKNSSSLIYDESTFNEEISKRENVLSIDEGQIKTKDLISNSYADEKNVIYDVSDFPLFELDKSVDKEREFLLFDKNSVYKVSISSDSKQSFFIIRFINKNNEELAPHLHLTSLDNNENIEEESNARPKKNRAYLDIPYNDIMRDRNGLSGKAHKFTGKIIQYEENEDGLAIALVIRDGKLSQIYQIIWPELPQSRFVSGDQVEVEGLLIGLNTYELSRGGTKTTPALAVEHIYIDGEEY